VTPAESTPLLDAARQLCASRGVEVLDLLETLEEHLEDITPPGCRVSQCGNCKRRSVVPTGEALRAHREQYGFSQGDVARLVGCAKQHVSHIEKDRRDATPPVVEGYERLAAMRANREEQPA
jgi:DNA-binding XRE family transcriptional regulator